MDTKKTLLGFIAFSLFNFGLTAPLIAADYAISDIALTPGADASQLNFAWVTSDLGTGDCTIQIDLTHETSDKSNEFKRAATFSSEKYVGKKAQTADGNADYAYCKVSVLNLKPRRKYSYRLGDNNGHWSDTYQYVTENPSKYGFVFVGDAQIGASQGRGPTPEKIAESIVNDAKGWSDNISMFMEQFPKTAFILHAGDQIETPGSEVQWAGFLSPAELKSIPIAPTPAAHDELGSGRGGYVSSQALHYHFNLPNEASPHMINGATSECPPPFAPDFDPKCAETLEYVDLQAAAGDYSFTYGDALYIVLNMDSTDYKKHGEYIQSAINAHPQIKWKITMWHYTIYSAVDKRRTMLEKEAMYTMMEENDIDLALQGHDHIYIRTPSMLQDVAQKEVFNRDGESVNPTGVTYVTANSSSGSKYYKLNPESNALDYVAMSNQENVPTFSYIEVDADTLKLTTYKSKTMKEIDTYTINKKVK